MIKLNLNKSLLPWILGICLVVAVFVATCERNKRLDAELNSDHLMKENKLYKQENEELIDSIQRVFNRIDTLSGESLRDYWTDFKARHDLH